MNWLKRILVSMIAFGLVTILSGASIESIYDSVIVSLFFSAVLASVLEAVLVLPIVLVFAYGALDLYKKKEVGLGCLFLFIAILVSYGGQYYIIKWCGHRFEWFPMLTKWWIFAYLLASIIVNMFDSKEK